MTSSQISEENRKIVMELAKKERVVLQKQE